MNQLSAAPPAGGIDAQQLLALLMGLAQQGGQSPYQAAQLQHYDHNPFASPDAGVAAISQGGPARNFGQVLGQVAAKGETGSAYAQASRPTPAERPRAELGSNSLGYPLSPDGSYQPNTYVPGIGLINAGGAVGVKQEDLDNRYMTDHIGDHQVYDQ